MMTEVEFKSRPRVALICDPIEENWPSMDLVGDMLFRYLQNGHPELLVTQIRPSIEPLFSRPGSLRKWPKSRNAARLIHRFLSYPEWLRKHTRNFDIFHIVDHSYSQLVHVLPPERTIISCHDLDTFRCVLDPTQDKRSVPFKLMTQRILRGFLKASCIACDSQAVRDELINYELVPSEKVTLVFHGTHPTCSVLPDPEFDVRVDRLLGFRLGIDYLLHVGSTIPRKRIDVLLQTFAGIKKLHPTLQLVRVGGEFTREQEQQCSHLGVRESISVLPHIDRRTLAAIYRRAALLLLTSEAEGFGLPIVEAMACGCPVIASDLAVLREIGGEAAVFCPVGDVSAWTQAVQALLSERAMQSCAWDKRRKNGSANAVRFTWDRSAAKFAEIYRSILCEVV